MSDDFRIVGLWASASGPVLWVRRSRGRSVLVSLAPSPGEPAINHGPPGREQRTVVGTWDSYYGELRIPLPQLKFGAELHLDYDDHTWAAEIAKRDERLTGGLSMDDVPGALQAKLPSWLLPREPYLRVPEAVWSNYSIVSSAARKRRRAAGPQNNEMHLTRSAIARRRGPRR